MENIHYYLKHYLQFINMKASRPFFYLVNFVVVVVLSILLIFFSWEDGPLKHQNKVAKEVLLLALLKNQSYVL